MANINTPKYKKRSLAQIIIEAATPLAVGSGEANVKCDSLVVTDVNELPYIPATSIAGVLRDSFQRLNKEKLDKIFGFQNKEKAHGSEIIFSEAKILNHSGKPVDGLDPEVIENDPLLTHYKNLPIRQHVSISDKGVAKDGGKFDEQVVFAGTRFCFEIELVCDTAENYEKLFESILTQLYDKEFRLGSGTRSGFGAIKVVDDKIKILHLDLEKEEDLNIYLDKSSSLDSDFWTKNAARIIYLDKKTAQVIPNENYIEYELSLTPESFFLFASGVRETETDEAYSADITPVKADVVTWEKENGCDTGTLHKNLVLMPTTSLKGVIAHRVAYHWNRMNNIFAEEYCIKEDKEKVDSKTSKQTKISKKEVLGRNNPAVKALFGAEGSEAEEGLTRGNVIITNLSKSVSLYDKLFSHVAIDRFTGAGIDGALFFEKVTYGANYSFFFNILINVTDAKKLYSESIESFSKKIPVDKSLGFNVVMKAFEFALKDITTGIIPLGGGTNRGHGTFKGQFNKVKQ